MTGAADTEPAGGGAEGRPPRLRPGAESTAAYRLVYARIEALLRGRPEAAERPVPACPAWTVRQLVAHLAGEAQDITTFNLDGAGTHAWTQAQVDRLAGHGIDGLLDLWGGLIEPVTGMLAHAPEIAGSQLVFDVLTHEHDIRGALDEPGSRTVDPAFAVAAEFLATTFDLAIRQHELPALRLATPTTGPMQLGDPATAAGGLALAASDFDVLRALGGRRSRRQLLALPWTADPGRLLTALDYAPVQPPDADLIE